jgi:hypothetical protein
MLAEMEALEREPVAGGRAQPMRTGQQRNNAGKAWYAHQSTSSKAAPSFSGGVDLNGNG